MSNRTLVTVNVHCNDSTEFAAELITDFVSLRVGADVDLFIMNSAQAFALQKAAMDAVEILKEQEVGPKVGQMMEAGKSWIRAIWIERPTHDFNAVLNWTLEDWEIVMNRHGSFTPTQADVDAFHARFATSHLRGLK